MCYSYCVVIIAVAGFFVMPARDALHSVPCTCASSSLYFGVTETNIIVLHWRLSRNGNVGVVAIDTVRTSQTIKKTMYLHPGRLVIVQVEAFGRCVEPLTIYTNNKFVMRPCMHSVAYQCSLASCYNLYKC